MAQQKIAILGSTGSIGTQALEVVRRVLGSVVSADMELFKVELLTANDNWEMLASQAIEFDVASVVIVNKDYYKPLKERLKETMIKVYCSKEALLQELSNDNIDTVLNAITGFAGLEPTIEAIKQNKKVALANKESLVIAGDLIMPLSKEYNAPILPIDSEHSAILQCLVGEVSSPRRIILTASGGALRDIPLDMLSDATIEQVLKHPSWEMGAKITVDSATMLNKGFEVIEAHHLFELSAKEIDVVIHPQSIIHSMVEFQDGAIKAQMGLPDMKLPIQYALSFPHRIPITYTSSYNPLESLTFKEVDYNRYPCLKLAYEVMEKKGICPTILNAAGEVAVESFLKSKIKYTDIYHIIEKTLSKIPNEPIKSFEQIGAIDKQARDIASSLC